MKFFLLVIFFIRISLGGGADPNCSLDNTPLRVRIGMAEEIVVAKLLDDQPFIGSAVNQELTVSVERVFKGDIKKDNVISLYYRRAGHDECDPEILPPLTTSLDKESKFLFYIRNLGGKRFVSQGQGVQFIESRGGRFEISELEKVFGGRNFSSWLKSLFPWIQ